MSFSALELEGVVPLSAFVVGGSVVGGGEGAMVAEVKKVSLRNSYIWCSMYGTSANLQFVYSTRHISLPADHRLVPTAFSSLRLSCVTN